MNWDDSIASYFISGLAMIQTYTWAVYELMSHGKSSPQRVRLVTRTLGDLFAITPA